MPDTDTQFWFAASTEEFMPSEMLEQARAAEEAGFDGTANSDHFAPWFPDGRGSPNDQSFLVGAGPEEHVARLREMLDLGPTVVCLQGIGDADPIGSIRRYGEQVLPALRRARV